MLPATLTQALQQYLFHVIDLYRLDVDRGRGYVPLPGALPAPVRVLLLGVKYFERRMTAIGRRDWFTDRQKMAESGPFRDR